MRNINAIFGRAAAAGVAIIVLWSAAAARGADERVVDRLQHEARGIYALWGQDLPGSEKIMALPFIHGSQIVLQWAEVEPDRGRYTFADLDRQLARLAKEDRWTTVQINGNLKPTWLFSEVPYVKEKLHVQVRDAQGTLMFWHPTFQAAHLQMLEALSAHLHASPYREKLLGLRLNFNAVGTEQVRVPVELVKPDKWIVPAGVNRSTLQSFTEDVRTDYENKIVAAYERLFADWVTVFVRNNINEEIEKSYAPALRRGRLALFHTSSEAEPRSHNTERQYGLFYDYCRSGDTIGYAEPWASAWGEHGGKTDPRWCSPAQWNYWTLLLNLHCGVSVIGEYYTNLNYAVSGEHRGDKAVSPNSVGPQEFMSAYTWAAEYVGRHNLPGEAPGAWVAFRSNDVVKAANDNILPGGRTLTRFTGDYNFLMSRVDGDGSQGVGPVGPPEQRYGAFARKFAPGQSAHLKADTKFLQSLARGAQVNVIYLDDAGAAGAVVTLETPSGALNLGLLKGTGTGRWITAEFPVSADRLNNLADKYQVAVTAGKTALTLHLVEIRRIAPVK